MASPEGRAHDSGEGRHIEDSNQSTSVKGEGGWQGDADRALRSLAVCGQSTRSFQDDRMCIYPNCSKYYK